MADSAKINGRVPDTTARPASGHTFRRSLGLLPAISINMTQMCGIGPFITIPLMVATMGGPQAILGWIVGALLAMADGLVWAELGAAMPGAGRHLPLPAGGVPVPDRQAHAVPVRLDGRHQIPLIMSTGVIGIVQYLGFFFPHLSWLAPCTSSASASSC